MTGIGRAVRSVGFALMFFGMMLPGMGHAQGTPQRGGTLVMVVQPEPPTLASYQSTAGPIGQ
ncbi:MAG TPA: hypothetical protein VFR50_11195, partial [Casimicrobiaceae bacterium]|nr:hypothetical protein [Casimicrobiaceae bacterium]